MTPWKSEAIYSRRRPNWRLEIPTTIRLFHQEFNKRNFLYGRVWNISPGLKRVVEHDFSYRVLIRSRYHFHPAIRISTILICIKRKLRFVKAQCTGRFFYWKFHTTLLHSCNLRVLKAFCIKKRNFVSWKICVSPLWVAKASYGSIKHFSTVSKTFFTRIKFQSYEKKVSCNSITTT